MLVLHNILLQGYVASCSNLKLCLHTINALPIAEFTLDHPTSPITCLAFLEREYVRNGVLATGHENGTISLRSWTAKDTPPGQKAQWKFITIRTLRSRAAADGHTAGITALHFVG